MLAIIPARGGSKGVPGKNIKSLCDKPLIGHTISAAQAAQHIDRIVLSTDDAAIASVCRSYGVDVPFMRPGYLAQDNSSAVDVYLYTLDRLNRDCSSQYSDFVVLQPTSPFRTAEDIDLAIETYFKLKADSVISVVEASHPPIWSKKISSTGHLTDYFPAVHCNKNRQEIETAYMPNGAVYVLQLSLLRERGTYYSEKTYPYIMPVERSIDIDTPLDFAFAEFLMRQRTGDGQSDLNALR